MLFSIVQLDTVTTTKLLTRLNRRVILSPLSQKTKDGICTPRNQGPQRPLSHVVFLCPSKTQAALCRRVSVMVGCIGQPLKRLAGALAGSANLIQSATQRFAPKGGGLFPHQGVTAMRNHAINPAISSQTKQSLFNLVKRTPQGPRVICQDLTFNQATGLIAEIPGTLALKFSKMGALL